MLRAAASTLPTAVMRGTAALFALALIGGCANKPAPPQPPAPTSGPFVKVVFIGDSLSAGFQNGSLLDTQQPNGFGSLVATQAKFPLQLPLIAPPGAPAVLQLVSAGFPPVIEQESGTTTGRDNILIQPNDLAVPGHTLHDLIYLTPTGITNDEQIITDLVLGAPLGNTLSQLGETVALQPTTVFVWAGNEDALLADDAGSPSGMTSLASFTADYTTLITALKTYTKAHLVVANIPDVTAIPYMTPGSLILSEASAYTHLPASVISALIGVQPTDLVNAQGLTDLEAEVAGLAKGGSLKPLPGSDVLTAAEQVTVRNNIAAYNQVIAGLVAEAGGTLVDLHSYVASLAASGITINGYKATNSFLGGLFGLDGIHPTNTAYALIANQYIAATNTAFGLSTPLVNVSEVASKDPYFGPNIKPVGAKAMRIPTVAAQRASQVIRMGLPKKSAGK
jgi:lysophospholipase L1-like esterase